MVIAAFGGRVDQLQTSPLLSLLRRPQPIIMLSRHLVVYELVSDFSPYADVGFQPGQGTGRKGQDLLRSPEALGRGSLRALQLLSHSAGMFPLAFLTPLVCYQL